MASTLLGRAECPECGFHAAHVKISDKANAKAYRHCTECGAQYFPRNEKQAKTLLAKTRAQKLDTDPAPAPAPTPEPAPTPAPDVPPAPTGYRYVLGVKVPTA
jgi:DNA-directed RNA polymerase subunit RPC12/RpoP